MIRQIEKRDGRTVPFDKKKIADAIFKAAKVLGGDNYEMAQDLAHQVVLYLEQQYGEVEPTVEQVQDAVEHTLDVYKRQVQNHSPYVMLSDSDRKIVTSDQLSDEELENINAYANGIADTDKALGELLDYIDQREKPTALLFFGDHQPLLDGCKRLATKEGEDVYKMCIRDRLYTATHSETLEPYVVYQALYGEGGIWVRPASMWNELVERDGKAIQRFTFIEE